MNNLFIYGLIAGFLINMVLPKWGKLLLKPLKKPLKKFCPLIIIGLVFLSKI